MATTQGPIPPVATILSTLGTIFWSIQLIPQIYHMYRVKSAAGVPASMMLLWSISAVPFGAYDTLLSFAIPLIAQPQIFGTLGLIVWAQCLCYGHGWSAWKATAAGVGVWLVLGALEVLLILTLRPVLESGVQWPVTLVGVVAFVMLTSGFVPALVEIVRRRGRVVGLNFLFLAIDWMGACFSLMGVATQGQFDILGGVLYIICAVIEIGIFISQGIWLAKTRKLRKQAKSMGIDFDDLPEAKKYQWPRHREEKDAFEIVEEPVSSDDARPAGEMTELKKSVSVQVVKVD